MPFFKAVVGQDSNVDALGTTDDGTHEELFVVPGGVPAQAEEAKEFDLTRLRVAKVGLNELADVEDSHRHSIRICENRLSACTLAASSPA